jgi:prepilin-type N-terminal cleavage/methylation domain-containing protein
MTLARNSGFSLLEVMVAAAVLAMAIAGVLSALAGSTRNAAKLTERDRAALLAQRKMDELLADRKLPRFTPISGPLDPPPPNTRSAGWTAEVRIWEHLPQLSPGVPVVERIGLEVWWEDAAGRRTRFPLEAYRRAWLRADEIPQVQAASAAGGVPQ